MNDTFPYFMNINEYLMNIKIIWCHNGPLLCDTNPQTSWIGLSIKSAYNGIEQSVICFIHVLQYKIWSVKKSAILYTS